jgi:hypothetical protein
MKIACAGGNADYLLSVAMLVPLHGYAGYAFYIMLPMLLTLFGSALYMLEILTGSAG